MAKRSAAMITARTVTAPIAAIIMAGLLYTYSVTSIRAAKRNAQLHREADGGQLNMRRESLRRHGFIDKVEGTGGLQLFRDSARDTPPGPTATNNTALKGTSRTTERGLAGEVDRSAELQQRKAEATIPIPENARSETEAELERYKGRGKLSELGAKVASSE